MALTYSELDSVTQKYYIPKLVDNIFASNSFLQRLRKKSYKPQEGGTLIMQPLLYAKTTATGWYSGTDTLNTTVNDQITAGYWPRAHTYASVTITHTDELENAGDSQVIDFVKAKVQAAELTIADAMGTGLFNLGTDAKAIVGLRLAIDSTGTYGGINRSDYTWWASDEDGTTTTLTLAAMQAAVGDVSIGNDKPSVAFTTQDILESFVNLLQPQQRFQDSETADAGFQNVMFLSIPIIADSHCPASNMFFVNEKYWSLLHSPRDNFRWTGFIKAIDQEVVTGRVLWAGQLVCSNCRMNGKMNALTD